MQDLKEELDPEYWLDRYGDALYRFALIRVGNQHVAEDLVQETLLSGIRSLDTFSGRSQIKTWLMTILRRRIADYFQRANRQPPTQSTQYASADELGDHEFAEKHANLYHPEMSAALFQSSLENEEFWSAARECIRQLPLHLRETFIRRISNDGKTIEEICHELDLTKTNFTVRLYRARLILRQCFEKYWAQGE